MPCFSSGSTSWKRSGRISQQTDTAGPEATLKHAAGLVTASGSVLEFGGAAGHTLRSMVEALPGRTVAVFDVFTGLPEDWRSGFPAGSPVKTGTFAQEGLPEVPGAELVVGMFEDALPDFLDRNRESAALLEIDADLYSATKAVLELVGPRPVEGSVVLFDEYFDYRGWQRGEHRAWQKFVDETKSLAFRYAGLTHDHEQVVLVLLSTGGGDLERVA